jgi:hypothetical protein
MINTVAALGFVKSMDEALGVIGKLVAKLKAEPDLAALKLAEALDEVRKTWEVVDDAIADVIKLGFDRDAMEEGSEVLLRIEGGGLLAEVEDGRGRCHVIGNIYHKHLDRWFERALKGEDLVSMRRVFDSLAEADTDVFSSMVGVARQLQDEATQVLDMIIEERVSEARNRVLALRKELQPLRLEMTSTLQKLYGLKGEFIKISGVA